MLPLDDLPRPIITVVWFGLVNIAQRLGQKIIERLAGWVRGKTYCALRKGGAFFRGFK